MARFQSLSEAVADNLNDGDTVAFEGITHLIPRAAREAIRQGRRDLTLIRMTPDISYDQLVGMGLANRISADRDLFARWMKDNVVDTTLDVFAAREGIVT